MTLVMRRPDDWHVHFRDGAVLEHTVPPIAAVFGRVVAMPNLRPPVTNAVQAVGYAARLREHASHAPHFVPLPSLYLTDRTTADVLSDFKLSGGVAAKLYPANATTNSDAGVTDMDGLDAKLRAMEELGLVLQVHGETTAADIDIFDRERRFIDDILAPLVSRFAGLRVVLEHVTTAHGVAFVKAGGPNVGATVTPHHLEVDRNAMFAGGLRPHLYCLPVPKTRADRDALLDAVLGGAERFFLGSDSAPHARHMKESACCAAGVYCGHHTLSHYAEVFARHGALDRLEAFASERGADFYGLARNEATITLEQRPFEVPTTLPFGSDVVVPYRAGEALQWQVVAT